jgi:hypothetical protein
MYTIRTESESLLEPTLLKQKLQLVVLAKDSKNQKLYYWDNRVKTYLNIGYLAPDSETISDYTQLTGSIHPLLGSIAYLILPGFESLGKIQFGYTNHYEWSRGREWEQSIVDINLHFINKYTYEIETNLQKGTEKLLIKDVLVLNENNLLSLDIQSKAIVKELTIDGKKELNLTISTATGEYPLSAKFIYLNSDHLGKIVNFTISKVKQRGYDLEVRLLENGEETPIGKFTTSTGSKDSLQKLWEAGIITNGRPNQPPQINQDIFKQVQLLPSGRDFKLNIYESQKLSIQANNNSLDLNLLPAPPNLPGVNISTDSEDYLGKTLATALGKLYMTKPNSDLEEIAYELFKHNSNLVESILLSGGVEWLKSCFHRKSNSEFSGDAETSRLVKAIISAYKRLG